MNQVGLASASQAGNGEFGTVLVIDTSKSMHGEAIAGAMKAAQGFADRRTPQQELGVVTLQPKGRLRPAADHKSGLGPRDS